MISHVRLRDDFLRFFKERDHKIIPSAPVVPQDDPTLLFTNAGMNQFKNIFLGTMKVDYKRAADTQKCLRVSGKHNDLDEVGRDTTHHTFFEMLGNWSFGDYFKSEAICWAWDFLVGLCGLPAERLYATYFGGDKKDGIEPDDEAMNLWPEKSGIPPERVLPFGKKDNFWEMGDVGPCGPCSEIHIDLGEAFCDLKHVSGHKCGVNGDCKRFIELWNLVFIQFNRKKDGVLVRLEKNHIDTGMGFERLLGVVNKTYSNYETDLFYPLFEEASRITGFGYGKDGNEVDIALRVISDHVKALTFAITDGAMPEKKGRGSVLRSLLRRAARFGRQTLGMKEPFIFRLPSVVARIYENIFPEVSQRLPHIENTIKEEENLFAMTIDRGLNRFWNVVNNMQNREKKILDGFTAYRLYHQDGFPRDLIEQMARENDLTVDEDGWMKAEKEHRERSKGEAQELPFDPDELESDIPATEFAGYWERDDAQDAGTFAEARIVKLLGEKILLLDRTPFYAESGGQVGDTGEIFGDGFIFMVNDTKKFGDYYMHFGEIKVGSKTKLPETVKARVDIDRRMNIMANHTATHLLHWALREVLGQHANQQGSEVNPDYLRFDVTNPLAISSEELYRIEALVNEKICQNIPVKISIKKLDEAKQSGVTALFGEKYSEWVRVIDLGGYSRELCGGTHCQRTGDIGFFYIVSESSSEAGVRRIEAVTRKASVIKVQEDRMILKESSSMLNANYRDLPARLQALVSQVKDLKKSKARDEKKDLKDYKKVLINNAPTAGESRVVVASLKELNPSQLGELADELRSGSVPVCGILASPQQDSITLIGFASKDLTKGGRIHIGNIVRDISVKLGGGGGGRPDFAKGGGKNIEKLDETLDSTKETLLAELNM